MARRRWPVLSVHSLHCSATRTAAGSVPSRCAAGQEQQIGGSVRGGLRRRNYCTVDFSRARELTTVCAVCWLCYVTPVCVVQAKLSGLRDYMAHRSVPHALRTAVLQHHQHMWEREKTLDEEVGACMGRHEVVTDQPRGRFQNIEYLALGTHTLPPFPHAPLQVVTHDLPLPLRMDIAMWVKKDVLRKVRWSGVVG